MTTAAAPRLDLAAIRAEFPVLRRELPGGPLVYLDNAATSQKPEAVLQATDRFYRHHNANIHRGVHLLSQESTRMYDVARESVRQLLNAADAREVIFTKGCTEAINLVSTCLTTAKGLDRPDRFRIGEGDEILLTTMEHHSNIVPWQIAAERVGARVIPIPITDRGEVDLDAYAELLKSGRVKFLGVVHVSNSLGTINPVREMIRAAHEVGALTLVDGAQAGPHHVIDVQDLDADFYTLSCHKIYAPTGVGVLYGKLDLLRAMPPYHGGGDMIRTVRFSGTTYAEPPARFEAGTPNIAGVIGLGASIDWIASLGEGETHRSRFVQAMHGFAAQERHLVALAEAQLSEIAGLRFVGQAEDRAGIVSFTLDFAHPHDIGTILDSEGVAIRTGHHCCMPVMERFGVPATARASFAVYNTAEEVEILVRAVRKVKELLG